MKRLVTCLMADYWETNANAKRESVESMMKLDIIPVLPRGDTYAPGDGCNPWPPPSRGRVSADVSASANSHKLGRGMRAAGARNAFSSHTLHNGLTHLKRQMLPLRAVGTTHPLLAQALPPHRMLATFRHQCSKQLQSLEVVSALIVHCLRLSVIKYPRRIIGSS